MIITYNYSTIKNFADMAFAHNLAAYSHLFNFKGFEGPNLTDDIKDAFLMKLNTSNPDGIPSFETFWAWVENNYGVDLAKIMCDYNYSTKDEANRVLSNMMHNPQNENWMHIKARVYRKWFSIMTEAQCTYAILRGIDKLNLNWKVISSPEMDGMGIDLAVVTSSQAVPIQIKKNTNSKYAKDKDNSAENFSRKPLFSQAARVLKEHLKHFNQPQADILIVKYGLRDRATNQLPYDYLKAAKNNFIYFDGEKIVQSLEKVIQ
jgi:hypothetical protein